MGGEDADAPRRQRAVRGDLAVAAAIDDVVEAHAVAVEADGNDEDEIKQQDCAVDDESPVHIGGYFE